MTNVVKLKTFDPSESLLLFDHSSFELTVHVNTHKQPVHDSNTIVYLGLGRHLINNNNYRVLSNIVNRL